MSTAFVRKQVVLEPAPPAREETLDALTGAARELAAALERSPLPTSLSASVPIPRSPSKLPDPLIPALKRTILLCSASECAAWRR